MKPEQPATQTDQQPESGATSRSKEWLEDAHAIALSMLLAAFGIILMLAGNWKLVCGYALWKLSGLVMDEWREEQKAKSSNDQAH